ncbi:hypothetical protein GCM10023322_76180 [Rugosimonospora acidiphila]|uniref:Tetratricopeptide repeat protein n=1 Tax=Rugosimonospora acidiphila TaxID=556531 RepID=A0ABP9SRG9_9ACTN
MIARVHQQVGDGASAVEAYQQAVAATPADMGWDRAEAMASLAECQARFGYRETAGRTAAHARRLIDGIYHASAGRQRARLDAIAPDAT